MADVEAVVYNWRIN